MTKVTDVFVPFSPAPTFTYVERPRLDKAIEDALSQRGAALLVHGPTATGKTTLVSKAIERLGFNQYVEIALGTEQTETELYQEIITHLSRLTRRDANLTAAAGPPELRASLQDLISECPVPIWLDDARSQHVAWLADLVKRVNQWERTIKKPGLTLIIAGIDVDLAAFTARRSKENQRLIAVTVQRFNSSEIESIIAAGESALNLRLDPQLKASIVRFSQGLPAVCHHLCSIVCRRADVRKKCRGNAKVLSQDLFLGAVDDYACTMEAHYLPHIEQAEVLHGDHGVRGTEILKALFELQEAADDFLGLHPVRLEQIAARLIPIYPQVTRQDVDGLVHEMSAPQGGEILLLADGERVLFREPVFRFVYRRRREGGPTLDTVAIEQLAALFDDVLKPPGAE